MPGSQRRIRVGLIMYRGEAGDYSSSGNSFYRYPYELYKRIRRGGTNVDVYRLENYAPMVGRGLSLMLGMAVRNLSGYDIVHNLDLAPVFPLMKGRAKLVSTVHDLQFIIERNKERLARRGYRQMLWHELILRLSTRSLFSSDYLIAVSSLTMNDAAGLGYDKNRIFVVNNGVDERFLKSRSYRPKERRSFVVGYLGAFTPRKDVPFAIRSFNSIKRPGFEFRVWGGKGRDREDAARIAGGNRSIKFMGYAPDDKIVEIYDGFDVFVFPTTYEGFGIPIIEAQARGLPVIIRKDAKIPDEVRKYCIKVEDEEHMAQAIQELRDNGYASDARRKAALYAKSFTWERNANETVDAYRKIIKAST